MEIDQLLDRWRAAGLLTGSQADAIRDYEARTGEGVTKSPPALRATSPPSGEETSSTKPPPPPGEGREGAPELPEFGLGASIPAVDLRVLGTVLAALALLSLLGNIFAVTTDLFLGPGQQVATEVEDALHLVASVLGLVGGLRLAAGQSSGRILVYWSLGLNIVATVLLAGARLKQPLTILVIAIWLVLFVLTRFARYRARYRYF